MKKILVAICIIVITAVACQSAPAPTPTATPVPPTAVQQASPTMPPLPTAPATSAPATTAPASATKAVPSASPTLTLKTQPTLVSSGALRPWIDTHAHPWGIDTSCTSASCVNGVIAAMDAAGVRKAILINPPAPAKGGDATKEADVVNAAKNRTDRFFYGIGGNMLNSRIDAMPDSGVATQAQKTDFQNTFNTLWKSYPAAAVLGEMATLHLSYEKKHAFEESPTNSDLMKLLADIAASNDRPIDVHIDVVTETMNTPGFFAQASPNNPPQVKANIPALESLLAYNRKARIVLAHVGRDTTGHMSASLIDRLLAAHPNLYAQIHAVFVPLQSPTAIVDKNWKVRPEWLAVLQKYPDRFVIGSDSFFTGDSRQRELEDMQRFLQQLPADLATKIGCTNPVQIYKLPSGC